MNGSPPPTSTRLPSSTWSRTGPVAYARVRQVKAGPRISSAAYVVTTFIVEAGLRGTVEL